MRCANQGRGRTMTRFVVPRRYQAGLKRFLSLDDETQRAFIDALSRQEATANLGDLIQRAASEAENLDVDDVEELTGAITGIYLGLYVYHERPIPGAVEDILNSQEFAVSEDERERVRTYLTDLLSIEALVTTTKAVNLRIENEHTFINARVLTDIRSVFDYSSSEAQPEVPVGAFIMHTLRISYYQDGQHKDFYVALDTADVSALQKTLKRADSKARGLESLLSAAGVRNLDAVEE